MLHPAVRLDLPLYPRRRDLAAEPETEDLVVDALDWICDQLAQGSYRPPAENASWRRGFSRSVKANEETWTRLNAEHTAAAIDYLRLMWLIDPEQFGGSAAGGIGAGFWWSAVTMTTVGYGDKAPVTRLGRVLATIWMFVSVITISSFTAAIASSITLSHFSTLVRGVDDLARVRSLAVEGSTGQQFLRKKGIGTLLVATPDEGLSVLRDGGAEALNRALLAQIRDTEWQETLNRYLGQR